MHFWACILKGFSTGLLAFMCRDIYCDIARWGLEAKWVWSLEEGQESREDTHCGNL